MLLIGLAKGGFSGMGALGMPLMALGMDPVRGAAILLPILIAQDAIGVTAFRKSWDKRILLIMLPGAVVGVGLGWLFAASVSSAAILVAVGAISMLFGLYRLWAERGGRIAASSHSPAWVGTLFGVATGFTSQIAHAGGPPYQMWVMPAKAGARRLRRHHRHLLRGAQLDQGPGLCRLGPIHSRQCAGDANPPPLRPARQPRRRLAGPQGPGRALLHDHLRADGGGGGEIAVGRAGILGPKIDEVEAFQPSSCQLSQFPQGANRFPGSIDVPKSRPQRLRRHESASVRTKSYIERGWKRPGRLRARAFSLTLHVTEARMNKPGPVPGRERVAKRRAALRARAAAQAILGARRQFAGVQGRGEPRMRGAKKLWTDHPEEWDYRGPAILAAGRSGLKRGDVVTIATGGGFGGKPRPAVIVQSDKFAEVPTLVVAPFTSELSDARVLRLRFQPESGNGLRRPRTS